MKFFATNIIPPKTKEECTKMNPVTLNLEKWASRLEVFGIVVAVIIFIYGVIMAFVNQAAYVEAYNAEVKEFNRTALAILKKDEIRFHVGTFISTLLTNTFYAFIEYCSCHAMALIISAVGMITYNTMITAKASLMMIPDDSKTNDYKTQKDNTGNKSSALYCPRCGNSYNGKYPCSYCYGMSDDILKKSKTMEPKKVVLTELGYIICPSCGKYQTGDRKACQICGQPFIVEDNGENKQEMKPVKVEPDDDGGIQCPICKEVQRSDRLCCYNCGQPFIIDEANKD